MKCAKCGLELLQGTRQCPKCGSVNEFEQAPPAPKKRLSPIAYAIMALAIVGLLSIGVYLMAGRGNVTGAASGIDAGGNITAAAPGQAGPGGITSAPPGQPAPGEATPSNAKPKPPQAVIDYLEHVKKVEEHRQTLLKDTGAALMLSQTSSSKGMIDMINMAMDPEGKQAQDPLADTKAELGRQASNWKKTLDYFDSKPAPPECREFSGAYRAVLYNETKTINDVSAGFSSVDISNPQDLSKLLAGLQKMKGDPSIQANIDNSADAADAKLNSLVANYDMKKPFDVPREKQGGNITGF